MEEAKSLMHQQLMLQQQAQLQQQEQLSLFQQQKQHHQQMQQQAMSRFPSNIDAHLIPPGLRNNNPLNPQPPHQHHSQQQPNPSPNPILNSLLQQQQQQQQQQKKPIRAPPANQTEVQMAYQDAWKVCHPEFNRPFTSLEDACERLLPYHVVADYEAEEDDRILESDTTGQILSRSQQWDNNIAAKVAEFTATFEKQVLAFNIISRKRAIGEFRSEERLMLEQALLQEEKQAMFELKTEMESREKASREAQLRMAAAMVQSEQARGVGPLRGSAVGSQGSDHDMSEREHGVHNPEEMMNGWGHSVQREDREPSEDFLNDEETDNGETSGHHEWREVGEFDLNTR